MVSLPGWIPINCLLTTWKCTYILDFRPWRWSALNMGFVVKRPSRMQGQCLFCSCAERRIIFGWVKKKFREGCPRPELTTHIDGRGVVSVTLFIYVGCSCDFEDAFGKFPLHYYNICPYASHHQKQNVNHSVWLIIYNYKWEARVLRLGRV